MPELPEVHTTVSQLHDVLVGKTIVDVWSVMHKNATQTKQPTLKNTQFYSTFANTVTGTTITNITRRGKHICIALDSNETILIHMKLTGHLLYGTYAYHADTNTWHATQPGPLRDDPFNQYIRVVFSLSDGNHLALSDMRKFAKVTLASEDPLPPLGPDPLSADCTYATFTEQLLQYPKRIIKKTLLDQSVIAGIGNIYADELLWRAAVHPQSVVGSIPERARKKLYRAMRTVLSRAISLAGDSTSDYRQPDGTTGSFHEQHCAYQKTGTTCQKRGCNGTIIRIVIGNRGTHFCDTHQIQYV